MKNLLNFYNFQIPTNNNIFKTPLKMYFIFKKAASVNCYTK